MNRIFIIVFLTGLTSCKGGGEKEAYKAPGLSDNIKAFIDSKKCFSLDRDIFLVNVDVRSDTLIVEISDAFPDAKTTQFNLDTILFNKRVIFTGKKIQGYSTPGLDNKSFPVDIIKKFESEKYILFNEFSSWLFLFNEDRLIYELKNCP